MNEDINIGFFSIGTTFCIEYTITNTDTTQSGNIAQNISVSLTFPSELSLVSSGSTVSKGTFDDGTAIWTIGALLPCASATASFCFTIDTDCPHPFEIELSIDSDVCSCTLEGSYDTISVDGVACCDFPTCSNLSHGDYADDTAAGADSVPVGGHYFNTTTGVMHTRMT